MKKRDGLIGIVQLLVPALVLLGIFFAVFASQVEAVEVPMAGVYDAQGKLLHAFPNVEPGSSVAVGDTNRDGEDEIVIGSAPGKAPKVTVYNKRGGYIFSFTPYGSGMISGVNVAVGDVTGHDNTEIITVPRRGASAHVMRFDGLTGTLLSPGFFAFSQKFHGGANIAVGDVNGDGYGEIVVGAGPGSTHVAIFNAGGEHISNIFPYTNSDGYPEPWGAAVSTIDIDGDGRDEVVVGPQRNTKAEVKVYSLRTLRTSFNAYGIFTGGVSVSANNSGGGVRVLLGAGQGGGPHVTQYNIETGKLDSVSSFPFSDSWREGVTIAFVEYKDSVHYFAIPGALFQEATINEGGKVVLVDLSEQRLYAYQNGVQVNTYLVSTGVPGMDTRVGRFSVTDKYYSKHYFGPGFNFPNTLYNLRFDGQRLLHGAYWHNDFGRRKSHGCVNISYPNAEWLYNWAPVGTTVIVQQ